jgi:hypothetical protein
VTDKPNKPDKRERLSELLSFDSKNFLGTGLTFTEFMQLHKAEQLAESWVIQPVEEQKRRRKAVIQLSIELGRITEHHGFSTRLAEMAIEAVIVGDWTMVQEWADHFALDTEGEGLRAEYAPVFAVFRELLLQALRTQKELPT